MFYVAIALILAGLFVLGYTIISNTTTFKNNDPNENTDKRHKKVYAKSTVEQNGKTDKNDSIQKQSEEPALQQRIIEKQPIDRMDLPAIEENDQDQEPPAKIFNVLFYEDSSRIIDYQTNTGTIDPGLTEYKKIKLIGKGELLFEKEGLSFYVGKKFRRFDFYSITKMQNGDDYLALFSKQGPVKLFVIKNNKAFISHVIHNFNNYKQ